MNRFLLIALLLTGTLTAQVIDPPPAPTSGEARIVIEAKSQPAELPLIFSATADATITITPRQVNHLVRVGLTRLQGKGAVCPLELEGEGAVTAVTGTGLKSWAVRQEGTTAFLDLTLEPTVSAAALEVALSSTHRGLPMAIDLAHLRPGKAAALTSVISINFDPRVDGLIGEGLTGFERVKSTSGLRFTSTGGGRLPLKLSWRGAAPPEAFLERAALTGKLAPDGRSIRFTLQGIAVASEADVRLPLLSGNAAVTALPAGDGMRWRLGGTGAAPVHQLEFSQPGQYPFEAVIVTPVRENGEWSKVEFSLPGAGAVVPVQLEGFPETLEFAKDGIVPRRAGRFVEGFLPASGGCALSWRTSTQTDDGRLFFTTTAIVDCQAGVGLLRQDHRIECKVLQGKLERFDLDLAGPGEIVAVEGEGVSAWAAAPLNGERRLSISLDQPIEGSRTFTVRTQTALEALPFTVTGLRLTPVGAVRHSGFLRLASEGAVRIEPVELSGLTQLAPGQFPRATEEKTPKRQVFAYRFPSGVHAFGLKVDRVQPEFTVSQTTVYRFGESTRVIQASLEFDVREAPVRELELRIPSEYSVSSVEGSEVVDFVPGTVVENGQRALRIVFGQGIEGRHLVQVELEWNGAATTTDWALPRLDFPEAKNVTGDIGVAGEAGFRLNAGTVTGLAERPVAQFPRTVDRLQQAFRIRERAWSAPMTVENLPQSIQTDVFHLYSLSERRVQASILLNYLVTGSPVSTLEIAVPKAAENLVAEGRDVRGWLREGDVLKVTLHQPVLGTYTLLVTWQQTLPAEGAEIHPGEAKPLRVASERGFLQVVSPILVTTEAAQLSPGLLSIDPMELPAELRLLNSAPPLATYQYTARPCDLSFKVQWFDRAETTAQLVEFAEVEDRISPEGDVVSTFSAFVKSRGQGGFRFQLPGEEDGNRLWSVTVGGEAVNARQDGDWMIVPLPAHANSNSPLQVQVKLGREGRKERTTVRLPVIDAPVLKSSWTIVAEGNGRLLPLRIPSELPQLTPAGNGARWLVTRGFWPLLLLLGLILAACRFRGPAPLLALLALVLTEFLAWQAWTDRPLLSNALTLNLPALAAKESISFDVRHLESGEFPIRWDGFLLLGTGAALTLWGARTDKPRRKRNRIYLGAIAAAGGILLQPWGAVAFLLALGLFLFWSWAPAWREVLNWRPGSRRPEPAVPLALLAGALLLGIHPGPAQAESTPAPAPKPWLPEGWSAPEAISETWTILDQELQSEGTLKLNGEPLDRFVFLSGAAVLTQFSSPALSVNRTELPGIGTVYVATLNEGATSAEATFAYRLPVQDPVAGFLVPSGPAAIHEVRASYDKPGWIFESAALMESEPLTEAGRTAAHLTLAAVPRSRLTLKPRGRDPKSEPSVFHVESLQLFVTRPGVIDGQHQFELRPSRGLLKELTLSVPDALTVGEVEGGVTSWRFDAEQRRLVIVLDQAHAEAFSLTVSTQRTLPDLPADVSLEPLRCLGAEGEVGLIAVATGAEIQIESSSAAALVPVNPDDFPVPKEDTVLQRVFRYGSSPGQIALHAVPVAPELRVTSEEVLSFGEERIVLNAKLAIDITRAGLFQLGFPVPVGYEVESLSGSHVRDWSESGTGPARTVRINLTGKTMGACDLAITLSAPTPPGADSFSMPRLSLDGVNRQTGQLVVRPAAGIRLTATQRNNLSEQDGRTAGAAGQGTLAFRVLHQDWALDLKLEKLDPWITAQVLQDVTLREGQTRTAILARIKVEQASIRSLHVRIPADAETVRAIGEAVTDLVKPTQGDLWELRFRRRIFGDVEARIEFERRRPESGGPESIVPCGFPEVNQLTQHIAIRTSGRLEMEPLRLPEGWQPAEWTNLPQPLRDQGNRSAPAESLRVLPNAAPLAVNVRRHELADALRLRVTAGTLRTVLSAKGDQVTVVDLTVAVVQRGSLELTLPTGAELFHIHVNGESANAVLAGPALRFHVLPNAGGTEAAVQVAYAVRPPASASKDRFVPAGPKLDIPMENLLWRVFLPDGLRLAQHQGGFRLSASSAVDDYDRAAFLSATNAKHSGEAREAEQLLVQANQYLQSGQNSLAGQIFNNAANRSGLDAASNEDARVQLDNLMTQQAIVGLNSRRQRMLLDNGIHADSAPAADAQLAKAADFNAVLNSGKTELAPQEMSQLLQTGSGEDQAALRRIAGRIVEQQQGATTAPKTIAILLPEGGRVHEFVRPVQAGANANLDLRLTLTPADQPSLLRWIIGGLALLGLATWPVLGRAKR